jgi:predicted aspartyl protease
MKNKQRVAALYPALFATITMAGSAQAETENPPAHCRYKNLATLPVKFSGKLITVEGSINGGVTTMMLDTGSQATELTRQGAEKFGLKLSHSRVSNLGIGGESETYATLVDDMSLDKLYWHRVKLGVISDIGISIGGLVGADILFNKDMEFSLANQQIKFFEPSECDDAFLAYWDDNASAIPLAEISPKDHRQVVTVEINGQKIRAMIDSGATSSVINLAAAARADVTPQSPGVVEAPSGVGVGKHHVKTWLASFKSFTIGGETIKNPKIMINDMWGAVQSEGIHIDMGEWLHDQPDMLLGADFLRTHHVLFAISQQRFYFSYLGGKVFDNGELAKLAADAKPK